MKKILIVVDFQRDFVVGSLGFEKAATVEACIKDKILTYRREGGEVAFTYDTHGQDYLETREGKDLPIPHCLEGSDGWQLYGQVASLKEAEDRSFNKVTFGSLELANYLVAGGYDSVELVGLVSNICILSNAVLAKAALPEADIIVEEACTASFDESLHAKTLDVLEGIYVRVIRS